MALGLSGDPDRRPFGDWPAYDHEHSIVPDDDLRAIYEYVAQLEGAIRHTVHKSHISCRTRRRLKDAIYPGGLL